MQTVNASTNRNLLDPYIWQLFLISIHRGPSSPDICHFFSSHLWYQYLEIQKCYTFYCVGLLFLYNMNGFRTETMYDYYIAMKFMFLVVKLSSHPSIGYASFTILLPWSTHKLHQNYSKAFPKSKLQFSQTLYSYHNFVQMKVFLKVTNTSLYTNQKETNKKTS